MEFIYVFINGNECEWEDLSIFLSKEDAINISKKYPNNRVEIFSINHNTESGGGYKPTYNYYQNGELIETY
jgi:hypothetical protein